MNQNLLIIASGNKGHPCWLDDTTSINVDAITLEIHNLDGAVETVKYMRQYSEYYFTVEMDST